VSIGVGQEEGEDGPLDPFARIIWDRDEDNQEDELPPGCQGGKQDPLVQFLGQECQVEIHNDEKNTSRDGEQIRVESTEPKALEDKREVGLHGRRCQEGEQTEL
jgi:hypothetical protein